MGHCDSENALFVWNAEAYARSWAEKGLGPAEVIVEPNAHHLDSALRVADPQSKWCQALWQMIGVQSLDTTTTTTTDAAAAASAATPPASRL